MVYLWLLIAFIFMAFLVWRDSVQTARRAREIEELRDLREDLVNTRDEVHLLMEQLDKAADAAVEKFYSAVEARDSAKPIRSAKLKKQSEEPAQADKPIDNTIMFPRAPQTASPKHQMVSYLADQGFTEDEIAQKMNIGKGEVILILQLKRRVNEPN